MATQWNGSLHSSVSASIASGPEVDPCIKHILLWGFFQLPLSQEEQVVSYQRMNVTKY